MTRAVQVYAPCRLHFGMLGFGRPGDRQFGGLGAMLRSPCIQLHIADASELRVQCDSPALATRARSYLAMACDRWRPSATTACRVQIRRAPARHIGLGVGTQLGLAIAAGVASFYEQDGPTIAELAASVDRGRRSSVGMHGFAGGGLVLESGKRAADDVGELITRVPLPQQWRFVLVTPRQQVGLHGPSEETAFQALPAVPRRVSEQLEDLAQAQVTAVQRGDLAHFGESLYAYGTLAGSCFASVQGGPFASPEIAGLVERIRRCGIAGVGQSSWGPTVYAVVENEGTARNLVMELQSQGTFRDHHVEISRACNRGARISDVASNVTSIDCAPARA